MWFTNLRRIRQIVGSDSFDELKSIPQELVILGSLELEALLEIDLHGEIESSVLS